MYIMRSAGRVSRCKGGVISIHFQSERAHDTARLCALKTQQMASGAFLNAGVSFILLPLSLLSSLGLLGAHRHHIIHVQDA